MSRFEHVAVLLDSSVSALLPTRPGVFVDATVGGGSFAAELLSRSDAGVRLVGMDLDPDALGAAAEKLAPFRERVTLVHRSFREVGEVMRMLGHERAVGIMADLGVSSHQLDGSRGFSFHVSGPLDMRMDPSSPLTARSVIDGSSVERLADLLARYGELPMSRKVAEAMKSAMSAGRMDTTMDLAACVRSYLPRMGNRAVAMAMQALRMAVNSESESLEALLAAGPGLLEVGGRLGVIGFHSLEIGAVRRSFRALCSTGHFRLGTKKPEVPTREEIDANPRSHSASFQWIERLE